jgi:hypothetical protein
VTLVPLGAVDPVILTLVLFSVAEAAPFSIVVEVVTVGGCPATLKALLIAEVSPLLLAVRV